MSKRKVLVTGAGGYVASLLLPGLTERYDCTLIDTRAATGDDVPEVIAADLLTEDLDRLRPLFRGQDAVVDLAYGYGEGPPLERFPAELANVRMAHNVLRVSLEEDVRRVVFGGSNHAADFYEHLIRGRSVEMLEPTNDVRPLSDNFYGWGKEASEHLGFVFAAGQFGRPLENVHIRIGAPRLIDHDNGVGQPYRRELGAYVSPRDLLQLFVRSIEAEDIRNEWGVPWQVFYGISDNTRAFWSLSNARRIVGYAPEDDSEVVWADDVHRHVTSNGIAGRIGRER